MRWCSAEGLALPSTSSITEQQIRSRWRFRYSIRSLLVFVTFVSLGLGFFVAYFAEARLDGDIRFEACACGFKRARVSSGKVALAEQNHDMPAGSIVATIKIENRVCILQRIGQDGAREPAERLEVDHLGAKYYDAALFGSQPIYVVMDDNWKLYPAFLFACVERLFR